MISKSRDAESFSSYYKKEKVVKSYDDQREANEYRRKKRQRELRYFLELIDKKEGEKVLELGCSSGFLTQQLGKVTAIDTCEGMLDVASKKNPEAKCIPGDMFNLNFEKNQFDKVVTMRVWNHLNKTDLRRAINEAKKVLKKGGYLIFDVEEKNILRKIAAWVYQTVTRITGYKIYQHSLKETKQILAEEGFKIEDLRYLNHRIGRQIIIRSRLVA